MPKKFHIVTHGCQMNKCDSELLASILGKHGYTYTEKLRDADIVLINTCSVRDTAERKVIGRLGRLKHLKQQRPEQLSGGEQQRVAVARAIACDAEILLLDEPLGSLDAQTRNRLRGERQRMLRVIGRIAIMVTHDYIDALTFGD